MWFLLLFAFPALEIYLLFKIGAMIGLANTVFYILASAVFGIGLIRTQGMFLLRNMQAQLAKGQVPADALLHSLLVFLSGVFFVVPGFISDFVALVLLVPGSRHLVARAMKRKLAQKLRDGKMRFAAGGFGKGPGGFGAGFGATFGQAPPRDVSPREIDSRLADVIDITPKPGSKPRRDD